jgi:hypothetical protein
VGPRDERRRGAHARGHEDRRAAARPRRVEHWSTRAEAGEYEVDGLLGYVAGVPTYSLLAERAVAVLMRGKLPKVAGFPTRLSETAPPRWRFHSRFSLEHARTRAERGDVVGTVGQVAKAITEHAHAVLCSRATWVLNEKRIIEAAGLAGTHRWFSAVPHDPDALTGVGRAGPRRDRRGLIARQPLGRTSTASEVASTTEPPARAGRLWRIQGTYE